MAVRPSPTTPIPRPVAPRRCARTLGAALLALGLLAGCAPQTGPQGHGNRNARGIPKGTAYVLIGSFGQEQLSQALVEEQEELVRLLEADFQQLHPQVSLQLALSREGRIPAELEARQRDGLAPDLLLVSGTTARELHRRQLSRPVPVTPELTRLLRPHVRDRLRSNGTDRQLVGVPMLLEPQLACFNRQRLPQSPTTLAALEEASERGIEVGIPVNVIDLYWSAGALGANDALISATRGQRLTAAQQEGVLRWLRWLRSANMRERVNFFSHQEALLQGLIGGQLDWITCRSTSLGRLRKALGERLGVAVLPNGPAGAPTPMVRQRVWVFGRDSSPNQRAIAEDFAHFSLSPMMQRYLTLHTQQMLPVSREVSMPTGGSPVLAAMVRSELQSRAADGISSRLKSGDPRVLRISQVLLEMMFGQRTPERVRGELVVLLGGEP